MNPANVEKLKLSQLATQQGDAITFDASSIQSLSNVSEVFLIFYLSKEDEYNGYGTVIQLDPATKQATIYSDLNPEYTYLFYKNESGELQSLLWCIEIATRTSDGLFIAHAKSYGRGISEEDLQRFSRVNLPQNQPETARRLTEEYTPQPTHEVAPQQASSTLSSNSPAQLPQQQMQQPAQANLNTSVQTTVQQSDNGNSQSQAGIQAESLHMSSFGQANTQPALDQTGQVTSTQVNQPAQPAVAEQEVNQEKPLSFVNDASEGPSGNDEKLNLPPLPQKSNDTQPVQQTQQTVASQPQTQPLQQAQMQPQSPQPQIQHQPDSTSQTNVENRPSSEALKAQANSSLPPLPEGVPDIFGPVASGSQQTRKSNGNSNKNSQPGQKLPVGRPPKPLLSDHLWPVNPDDFSWAKKVSRQPIAEFRDLLQQKVIQQIRANKPGLIEDWEFNGQFEKVFSALCTTYDVIPSLRHDILKSLLNGRVVESVQRSRQQSRTTAGV